MSRIIKFRIWDKTKKCFPIDGQIYLIDAIKGYRKNLIAEQYTGLNDKNGKEIYEGDIIQETIIADDTTDGTFQYEVYWDDDTLCWSIKGISDVDYHLHTDLWETNASREVIGNVHENPELLGGEE